MFDIDRDTFSVITDLSLVPDLHEDSANYSPVEPYELPDGKESEVGDICDFFVQYINYDVLVHQLLPLLFDFY